MKSGTQLLNVRSSGANSHFQGYKRHRFEPLFIVFFISRPGSQGPIQQETKTVLDHDSHKRLLSYPLSSRGHVEQPNNNKTVISLFLLKETEAFVPHNREARTHQQRPSSGFIKARERHRKRIEDGWETEPGKANEPNTETKTRKHRGGSFHSTSNTSCIYHHHLRPEWGGGEQIR